MSQGSHFLLDRLIALVAEASSALAAAPRRAGYAEKEDGSPVTDADRRCEQTLSTALRAMWPGLPIIGEESAPPDGVLPDDEFIALIDPLDGTRAFADGGADFCVNLAILKNGAPWLGVIGAPMHGLVYAGEIEAGRGVAWREWIEAREDDGEKRYRLESRRPASRPPVALASGRHGDVRSDALIRRLGAEGCVVKMSSALKFGLLAEGKADLYPRLAPTMAWDTAAGQAILEAAGGAVLDASGAPLRYAPGRPLRNPGFIAVGDPALVPDILPPGADA